MTDLDIYAQLASWTSRALQALGSGAREAQIVPANKADDRRGMLSMVAAELNRAARRTNQRHHLCSLPGVVIQGICLHLRMLDILRLSHVSHGLRIALTGVPEVWSTLPLATARNIPWLPIATPPDILELYAEASGALPLQVSLALSSSLFGEQAEILRRHMLHVSTLRLVCLDDGNGQPGNKLSLLLREGLSEPAPRLTALHLSYTPPLRGPAGEVPIFEPLDVWGLFGGFSPSLCDLRLVCVRLSMSPECATAFQNVTTFIYDLRAPTSDDDLHILRFMPRLENFMWRGDAFALAASNSEQPACVTPSLRKVYISLCTDFDMTALRGRLPVDGLSDLWISEITNETYRTLTDLYPGSTVEGISLSCDYAGMRALMQVAGPQGETKVMVIDLDSPRRLLMHFTAITWLTVYCELLDNSLSGPLPAMPDVTVLSVCLPSFDDYAQLQSGLHPSRWSFTRWSAGGFTADPASRWALPSLREVRITAPPGPDGDFRVGESSLSAALHDVARWISQGLAVEPSARKLDVVVLSGVHLVDIDFCASWRMMAAVSHALDLCERPDTRYFTAAGDMDFPTHDLEMAAHWPRITDT